MTRPTLLLAAAVSLAAATASAASVAQADTYCVAKPACAAQPSGHAAADLTTALADAAAHGGPDRIEIGPGIFPYPGATPTVQYTNDITEIVGAGRDATILMGGTGQFALGVDRAGVTVSDLGITLVDNVDSKGLRLAAAGDVARRLDVDAGHPTSSSEGIGITAGATLDDVRVAMGTSSGSDGVYVYGAGGAQLDHVAITAGYPLRVNSADALTTVSHARITGAYRVAYIQSPNELAISDSVLVSASGTYEAVGVDSAGPCTTLARITRSTLVGKGLNGVVRLNQTAGAGTAKAILRGVAIVGTGAPFARTKTTGAAIFDVDASAFGPGYTPGAGDVFGAHDVGAPSGFADAAAGDFRLRPDSPLVDAGGADASALPGGATDLDGAARVVDGNGDTTAQADIGAFEHQRPAAPVIASPATTPDVDGGSGTPTEA